VPEAFGTHFFSIFSALCRARDSDHDARSPRHKPVNIFAMINYRTMVDRPNRRPFLGVAHTLRAGVHSVAAGRPCRSRGAARRAHAPEWSTLADTRWEGSGWCGPIIKPAKHLQPTRVGQTSTETGPGCARIDDSTPPPRSPDTTSPCGPERILTCVQQCGGGLTVFVKRPPSLGTSCMHA
jgi:hypothetical protein